MGKAAYVHPRAAEGHNQRKFKILAIEISRILPILPPPPPKPNFLKGYFYRNNIQYLSPSGECALRHPSARYPPTLQGLDRMHIERHHHQENFSHWKKQGIRSRYLSAIIRTWKLHVRQSAFFYKKKKTEISFLLSHKLVVGCWCAPWAKLTEAACPSAPVKWG